MNEIKLEQKRRVRIHLSKKRKTLLVIIGLMTVLIVVAAGSYVMLKPTDNDKPGGVCSKEIIQRAAPLVEEGNGVELASISKEITAQPDYQTDVNCMYIIVSGNIALGEAEQSQRNLDVLKAAYDKQGGYSEYFGDRTLTPEQLQQPVDFLVEQAKVFESDPDSVLLFGGESR